MNVKCACYEKHCPCTYYVMGMRQPHTHSTMQTSYGRHLCEHNHSGNFSKGQDVQY